MVIIGTNHKFHENSGTPVTQGKKILLFDMTIRNDIKMISISMISNFFDFYDL